MERQLVLRNVVHWYVNRALFMKNPNTHRKCGLNGKDFMVLVRISFWPEKGLTSVVWGPKDYFVLPRKMW